MTPLNRLRILAVLALCAGWSCMTATDVERLEVSATGVILGQAYLDRNGSGAAEAGDTVLRNASVELVLPGTQIVMAQDTTDSLGLYFLADVPVGAYQLRLAASVLGDSLVSIGPSGDVTVELGDTTLFSLGASYPQMTLAEALAAPPGRRLFTSGIVLNPRQFNGDGLVFFQGPGGYLRGTNVDRVGMNVGDSVRLLGRRVVSQGRPALDAVTPFVLVPQAQFPIPVDLGIGAARTANAGALDAGLVRIRNAYVTDTSTVGTDFHFRAHDGTDTVEVVLRSFLSINPAVPLRPDTVVWVTQAIGHLAPVDDGSGTIRWRLLVRSASEISTNNRTADVAVTSSFDTLQATAGDTVTIRVTVRNAIGPQTASGVQVLDTIPSALTYVSSTATRGSYDPVTRLWSVGSLPAGAAADTLRIRATVTGSPGSVANRVYLQPLSTEIETNPTNNAATTAPANLTIS